MKAAFALVLCSVFFANLSSAHAACDPLLKNEPVPAAIGILSRDDGRKLVLKRSEDDQSFPGQWSVPGGKLDLGEAPDQAVVREFLEETGLHVRVTRALGARQTLQPGRKKAYLIYVFEVEQVGGGDVRLSREHSESAWVDPLEASRLELAGSLTRECLGLAEQRLNVLIAVGATKESNAMRRLVAHDVVTSEYISNLSTGSFGSRYALAAAGRGHRVVVLAPAEFQKMAGALPPEVEHRVYGATHDLGAGLERAAGEGAWDVVLHATAVSDSPLAYETPDLINRLRHWFGGAYLVGFEFLSGAPAEVRLVLPDGNTLDLSAAPELDQAREILRFIEDRAGSRSQ